MLAVANIWAAWCWGEGGKEEGDGGVRKGDWVKSEQRGDWHHRPKQQVIGDNLESCWVWLECWLGRWCSTDRARLYLSEGGGGARG